MVSLSGFSGICWFRYIRAICQGWAREEWQEISGIIGPWSRLGECTSLSKKAPASSSLAQFSTYLCCQWNLPASLHCIRDENYPSPSAIAQHSSQIRINCKVPWTMMQKMQDGECECVLWRQMCQLTFEKMLTIFWEGLLVEYCEIYREISLIALLTFLLLRYSMPLATCQLKQRMSLVVTCWLWWWWSW